MNKIQKQPPIRSSKGPVVTVVTIGLGSVLPSCQSRNPVKYILKAAGDFRQDDQDEQDSEAAHTLEPPACRVCRT